MSVTTLAKKIFVVEDDLDLSEMLCAYFQRQGYEVLSATYGEDAVAEIPNSLPDVVLLDIRLPDIDGYEVCRRLRKIRRTQNLPVIFLTERREREDKLAGLELGAIDYITKPFDIQELRLRVRNALDRAQTITQLNSVTGLPEGEIVDERIVEMLQTNDWGSVLVAMGGINGFRDKFGFVAADDVSRAVTLMLTNVVKEKGGEVDFIGHGRADDYLILTDARRVAGLAEQCQALMESSMQYFYPAQERQRLAELPADQQLTVMVHYVTPADGPFADSTELYAALAARG